MALEWEAALLSRSSRCEHSSRAPRLALCVAGAARTFASPLALACLRHNLLHSLGPATRLFLQLKTDDSAKMDGWFGRYEAHSEAISSAASVQRAIAAHPWLSSLIGEAVIVNGSEPYSGEGSAAGERVMIAQPRRGEWRAFASPHCAGPREAGNTGTPFLHSSDRLVEARMERQLRFYLSQEWCRHAIIRYERATARDFEAVMFVRPDLLWFRPMRPYCEVNYSTTTALSCPTMGCDQAWTVPRRYMDRMLGLAHAHQRCNASFCCGEDAERATGRAAHEAGANINRVQLHFNRTILRNVQGVCNVVTHPYYSDGRYAYGKEKAGPSIPIATGIELRTLLGLETNRSMHSPKEMKELLDMGARAMPTCERMLGATPCGSRTVGIPCGWGEKF